VPATPPNAFFFDWTARWCVSLACASAEEALGAELARLGHQDVVHAVATSSPVVPSG
jgi:hypothetical protein